MPAKLNGSRMNVTTPDQQYDDVQVIIREGVASVRSNKGERLGLIRKNDVTAVTHPTRKTWAVAFADGTVWGVERNRDCGCH